LKELIEMGGDNMKDFVGNGLLVNVMYKVSLSYDKELFDVQKLMYVLTANAEFNSFSTKPEDIYRLQ
jgi:hypothetical protein